MHVLDEIDVKRPESLFKSPEVIQKSQFLPSKVLQANYFYFNADNRKTKDFIKTHTNSFQGIFTPIPGRTQ